MNKFFVLSFVSLISLTVILSAACGGGANSQTSVNADKSDDANRAANSDNKSIDSHRTFRVEYQSEPGIIEAGKPANLIFTVKDQLGAVVKDFQIVHEKPLHLLMVSKDLAEFYHVHPEQSADGSFRIAHTFPNGGEYKLYADFTPQSAVQVVEQIDVKVGGAERAKVPLQADANFTKTVDGLRVAMKPDGEIRAGKELMLTFQAFDAATGKPAADLQNYLGELAHFVIISEDMKDFVHAHPMSKDEKSDMKTGGDDHSAGGHEHSTMEGTTTKLSESEVAAHTSFPRPGLYKIWAQFQRGGRVITVPFVINVGGDASKTTSQKTAEIPADAVKVTVSAAGFEPASINVIKGQPVRLAFYRPDEEGCGDEVVFSKLNIRKKLPVGETVLVEFTPETADEITFSCGMDMLRGKILVSES